MRILQKATDCDEANQILFFNMFKEYGKPQLGQNFLKHLLYIIKGDDIKFLQKYKSGPQNQNIWKPPPPPPINREKYNLIVWQMI